MPSEKQAFEGAGVPLRRFTLAGLATFAVILACLAGVFGLYALWVNGPQAPVTHAPLANASAPLLETEQFRRPQPAPRPAPTTAAGYRWRDAAHARVDVPVERAMAMIAARGGQAFDPVEGAAAAPEAKP